MNNKGFAHILILLIVVFGIGVLVYFSWQSGFIKTTTYNNISPTSTTISDEIVGWRTYHEDKFAGLEFKYPTNWHLEQDITTSYTRLSTVPIEQFEYGILPKDNAVILIDIGYRNKTISINNWCTFHPNYKTVKTLSTSKITVSGKQAFRVEYENNQGNQIGQHICYQTNKSDPESETVIDLDFYYYKNDRRKEYYINTFDQILSTFRFLDHNPDWLTYKNEEYGFETNYFKESPPEEIKGNNKYGQFAYAYLVKFGTNPLKFQYGYEVRIRQPMDLEDYKLELIGHITDSIDSTEEITINEIKWTKLNYKIFMTTDYVNITTVFTNHNGKTFEITTNTEDMKLILPTFKFKN